MTSPSSDYMLEVDSSALSRHIMPASTKEPVDSCGSPDDGSIPGMIMLSSSLQTFSDSDNDSLSSSFRSMSHTGRSPASPRSLFRSYWSSPTHKNNLENDQDDALERLQKLKLPFTDDWDHEDSSTVVQAPLGEPNDQMQGSVDDTSVAYQAASLIHPARSARRQILPTPPPPSAMSSSLLLPRRQQLFAPPSGRLWSSTTALLLKRSNQSCLRKSRYSCSAIPTGDKVMGVKRLHHGLRNDGCRDLRYGKDVHGDDLKKSVSFYSHVSVFEFDVPSDKQKSQKDWSAYFAGV